MPVDICERRVAAAHKNQRVPDVTRDNEEMHWHDNSLSTSPQCTGEDVLPSRFYFTDFEVVSVRSISDVWTVQEFCTDPDTICLDKL